MSLASDICDFWSSDLVTNVPALGNSTLHKYTSKSIEALLPDGTTHLAVWPIQDQPQQRPGTFGGPGQATGELTTENLFNVLYWEPSSEGQFIKSEEDAAKTLLQLAEDMRARFLVQANRTMVSTGGKVWRCDWRGTQTDTGGATTDAAVRYITLMFACQAVLDYS